MATATRKFVDCRAVPSEKNCSLYIAGTEDEVMKVAVRHAVSEHGHADTPELHKMIREALRDEGTARPQPSASASAPH